MSFKLVHKFTPDSNPDLAGLRTQIIQAGAQTYSSGCKPELDDHMAMLTAEFSGRSALGLFHAATTVFIRRGLNKKGCERRFMTMWLEQTDALISALDTRWLISACDTFMDISTDPIEQAEAMAGSLFTNTIKLHETERLLTHDKSGPKDYDLTLTQQRAALFDGMSAFSVGQGDMIANLFQRVDAQLDSTRPTARIVAELIQRCRENNTVYKRFQNLRMNSSTKV